MGRTTDWQAWHDEYADPGSPLSRRLELVRGRIAGWLDERPDEPVRILSACAGDGRDLLGLLAERDDAARVTATLVELDPELAAAAARTPTAARVEVRCADAGDLESYAGAAPADLVLFCGVFGNLSDEGVRHAAARLPELVAPGGSVIWTRTRRAPDLTPALRGWLSEAGFEERGFDAPADAEFTVGVHRLASPVRAGAPGERRMFRFVR